MEQTREVYYFCGTDTNPTAKKIDQGKLTTDLEQKENIVSALKLSVESKKLKKAKKIESEKNISYVFAIVASEASIKNAGPKYLVKVIVSKRNWNESDQYIKVLESITEQTIKMRRVNALKTVAIGTASILLMSAFAIGLSVQFIEEGKIQDQKNRTYISEINEARAQQNMPPLGYVDADGYQCDTWEDYFRSQPQIQEDSEQIESTKTK